MKNVAVILSGCGYLDGSEIREAVITLLELDKAGAAVQCFAPNINQLHVVDHISGKESPGESRNVLTESARIARGKVKELQHLRQKNFDALILPGGFGVAKNLSNLATKGDQATVLPEFKDIILDFIKSEKPIGAICISPAVLTAAVRGEISPSVTIGDDTDDLIKNLGGKHSKCPTEGIYVDETNKIISCSAYMRDDAKISDVASGIAKLVKKVIEIA